MTIMRQVKATTMERRLAAETLAKALENIETGKEPATRVVETARRLHRKKTHYVPAHPPLATSLVTAK